MVFLQLARQRQRPPLELLCSRYESQVGLVRNSWSDLFVLGLAQISTQVSIPTLLSIIVSHQQTRLARENTPINVKEVTASICKIHDYVQTLGKLNISATEFAYLRSIALFGAGKRLGVWKLRLKTRLSNCKSLKIFLKLKILELPPQLMKSPLEDL